MKQFHVTRFPTLIFVKPDGAEIARVHGLSSSPQQERNYLERVLDPAGPLTWAMRK